MGFPKQPRPVKLFITLLSNQAELFARLETDLVASFGALIPPERLAEIKILSHRWEADYQWVRGEARGRKINIDPGYLDVN